MYCPNCGKENPDGSLFCESCGTKFDTILQEPIEPDQQKSTKKTTQSKTADTAKQEGSKKSGGRTGRAWIIVIIVVVIAIVVIAVIWHHTTQNAEQATENISGTDANVTVSEDESVGNIEDGAKAESELTYKSYDVSRLSEEQQNMLGPMDSVAYAMHVTTDNYSYDWNNGEYVWEALYCLICNYQDSLINETGAVTRGTDCLYVTEDFLKECASAMFVDFNGQLPANGSNAVKEGSRYKFGVGDRGDEYARISSWIEYSDGTCTAETQIGNASTGELMQTFRFKLVKNTYTESENNPYYVYSIASVENIYNGATSSSDTTVTIDYYILPESDSRYYTESELSALSQDQLRLARNEIYARHGRIFDSEDLQTYFEAQPWYHGTISAEDFSESMLNEYEKANVRTIQSLES